MKALWVLGVLGATSLSCGDSEQTACTPGQSIACTGPGACSGFQVCAADGMSYGTCDCSDVSTSTGTSMSNGGGGAAQGGDMTVTSSTGGAGGGGGAMGGAGGAEPFSPTDLPGLALWLHTGAGVIFDPQNPGNVIRWDDQSPNEHQAVSQSGVGWEPTIDPAAVNGYDAVRCFGTSPTFLIDDDPSLQWGTGGFLLAGVIRPGTSPTTGFNVTRFLAKDGISDPIELSQPTLDTIRLGVGADAVAATFSAFPQEYRLVIARGTELELRVDSALSTGPTATANIDNAGNWVLFCGAGSADIAIAEFIAVKGEVSDADAEQVRTYLAEKYEL